mgnify:CR=1 FL=1
MSYPTNKFVPNTYKRECDVCGFDFLRSELIKDWQGRIVCRADFEVRHPRDYPRRARKEKPFRRE